MKSSNRSAGVTESRHILWVYLLSIAGLSCSLSRGHRLRAVVFGNLLDGADPPGLAHFEPTGSSRRCAWP
jgi:hypothetical protein